MYYETPLTEMLGASAERQFTGFAETWFAVVNTRRRRIVEWAQAQAISARGRLSARMSAFPSLDWIQDRIAPSYADHGRRRVSPSSLLVTWATGVLQGRYAAALARAGNAAHPRPVPMVTSPVTQDTF